MEEVSEVDWFRHLVSLDFLSSYTAIRTDQEIQDREQRQEEKNEGGCIIADFSGQNEKEQVNDRQLVFVEVRQDGLSPEENCFKKVCTSNAKPEIESFTSSSKPEEANHTEKGSEDHIEIAERVIGVDLRRKDWHFSSHLKEFRFITNN